MCALVLIPWLCLSLYFWAFCILIDTNMSFEATRRNELAIRWPHRKFMPPIPQAGISILLWPRLCSTLLRKQNANKYITEWCVCAFITMYVHMCVSVLRPPHKTVATLASAL